MGFKTCSQDEFDRAMRKFDKLNRQNKNQHKEPTLAEQLAWMDALNEKNRQERIKKREQNENKKYFSPLYEAKFKAEQNEKNKG